MASLVHIHLKVCKVIQVKCYMNMYTFPTPLQTFVSMSNDPSTVSEISYLNLFAFEQISVDDLMLRSGK